MLKEFKEFALRGNALDMAVGIIIGAAFGKIISSLVNDILMPPLGMLLGKVNFSQLHVVLHQQTVTSPAVILNYGIFINTVIDFIIVAFALFLVIRQVNRFTRTQKSTPATKTCRYCRSDISAQAIRCPACTSEL